MELKFSEMSLDTSLAKEYLDMNKDLLELLNDYDGTISKFDPYVYDGKTFHKKVDKCFVANGHNLPNTIRNMATNLKKNANLIAQLEYHLRNIPIEVTSAQLNLIIQYMKCYMDSELFYNYDNFYPNDSLLMFGMHIQFMCKNKILYCTSRATAAICHLFVTLLRDAGNEDCLLYFKPTRDYVRLPTKHPVKEVDSGTVAVVSDDADVDSAVDKLLSVSKQAPWRLRRILVQESVYQQFKDALSWKCNLKASGDKSQTSDVLCSDTLTYNDRTFLIDAVELVEENPSVVTVEAYRTTKEMISLLQQDTTRYLSLWTNGIAEINEVTHATKVPVVWVNNVADFRGPAQVSGAVFSYTDLFAFNTDVECESFTKLCKLSQSWLKLDVEIRRDILCSVLDKYILLNNANKQLTEIRNSLLTCTLKSFVDVGKDYVCVGMSQPLGVIWYDEGTIFSVQSFQSILHGNALLVTSPELKENYTLLEQAGVPVVRLGKNVPNKYVSIWHWKLGFDTVTRVVWTNSGTIFAN